MILNKIYFHIAQIGNYEKVCEEIFDSIIKSGILQNSVLYLSILGKNENIFNIESETIFKNSNINLGEFPTLEKIKEHSIKDIKNYNILYLHTKGVTTPNNLNIDDWRKYMLYFNVTKFKDCIDIIKNNDTCGVDLRKDPVLHYSGNFWWSKSNYLKTLPDFKNMPIILSERHKSEFWICSNQGKHYSMWDCGINQYEKHLYPYKENNYKI